MDKDAGKQGLPSPPPPGAPTSLLLPARSQQPVIVDPAEPTVTKRRPVKPTTVANQGLVKPTTARNQRLTKKPPVSPTSVTAAGRNTVRPLG